MLRYKVINKGNSPWGQIDQVIKYSRGFSFVSTPSHGGFRITKKVLAEYCLDHEDVSKHAGIEQGNYVFFEEDCAWCLLFFESPRLLQLYCEKTSKDPESLFQLCKKQSEYFYPKYFQN